MDVLAADELWNLDLEKLASDSTCHFLAVWSWANLSVTMKTKTC